MILSTITSKYFTHYFIPNFYINVLINNVTSVEEYKETMLETVYFLIQNEKASNEKDLALHHFAQRYRDIYSGK